MGVSDDGLPDIAISIQQPWSWLIVNGWKDIENRTWRHSHRGPVAIHAGKVMDREAHVSLLRDIHPANGEDWLPLGLLTAYSRAGWGGSDIDPVQPRHLGGIVGVADIIDCVSASASPWFVGPYGFELANARPVPFIPCRGALGFFRWRQ